ncbi:Uncharacterised protein [Bifidobacterium longum subsp. infantis]|nr:Uncharacterised protein [Bifidobacterium longum subsp. infantis]
MPRTLSSAVVEGSEAVATLNVSPTFRPLAEANAFDTSALVASGLEDWVS